MAPLSRRSFLFTAGAAVASSPAAARAATGLFPAPLYPPADLSYFDTPVTCNWWVDTSPASVAAMAAMAADPYFQRSGAPSP